MTPATDERAPRASANPRLPGLRARLRLSVEALGENAEADAAHLAAVREELGAVGPIARHLAETAGCSVLRAARAERLEGELLAGLAEGGRSAAAALHADRDARATLALLNRCRREADADVRRSLESLVRLHRARTEDLLPGGEEAEAAQDRLDAALAYLPAPSEPRIEKIELGQSVAPSPANDDAPAPERPPRTGAQLLHAYRMRERYDPAHVAEHWAGLTPEQQAAVLEAADEERRAREEGRDPESLHAAVAGRLSADPHLRRGPA